MSYVTRLRFYFSSLPPMHLHDQSIPFHIPLNINKWTHAFFFRMILSEDHLFLLIKNHCVCYRTHSKLLVFTSMVEQRPCQSIHLKRHILRFPCPWMAIWPHPLLILYNHLHHHLHQFCCHNLAQTNLMSPGQTVLCIGQITHQNYLYLTTFCVSSAFLCYWIISILCHWTFCQILCIQFIFLVIIFLFNLLHFCTISCLWLVIIFAPFLRLLQLFCIFTLVFSG